MQNKISYLSHKYIKIKEANDASTAALLVPRPSIIIIIINEIIILMIKIMTMIINYLFTNVLVKINR